MTQHIDLTPLSRALRELHRVLMERARRDYERSHITQVSPGELLTLLTTDDEFAWLRELSELMADVDIVADTASDDSAAIVRPAVEHLLGAPDAAGRFAQRYWPALHDDPHVAMAHAALKQALGGLPPPAAAASGADSRRMLAERALAQSARRQA